MEYTKKDFLKQIAIEQQFYDHSYRARILGYDSYMLSRYLYHLRMAAWYEIAPTFWHKLLTGWHKYRLRYYGRRTGWQLGIHSIGFGVKIYHWGCMIINGKARIGKNLTIYPGVTVGATNTGVPTIGDNVFLGLGCKVFGKIHIGDNVVVAPNAVVVKDVPSDSVVAGIPAKVIKKFNYKTQKWESFV